MLELCVKVCYTIYFDFKLLTVTCLIIITSAANTTTYGACSDGEIRLGDSIDDYSEWTRRGRVELCINNAWGTVCGTSFSIPDAQATCNQLVGFQREGRQFINVFE